VTATKAHELGVIDVRRPDGDIKSSIEAQIRRALTPDEAHIAVRVIGGAVTLTGRVHKHFHKYAAEDAVKRVPGVTAIANDVRVCPATRPGSIGHAALRRASLDLCPYKADEISARRR